MKTFLRITAVIVLVLMAIVFLAVPVSAATQFVPSLKTEGGVPVNVLSSRTVMTPRALTLGLPSSVAGTNYALCTNAVIPVYPGKDIRFELFGGTTIVGTNTLDAVTNGVFAAKIATSADGIAFAYDTQWLVFTPTATVTNQRVTAILRSTNIYPCKAVQVVGITNLTSRTLYPTNLTAFQWFE